MQATQNPGGPADIDDDVTVDCTFSDPAGKTDENERKKVVQPPAVLGNRRCRADVLVHHGQTGTGPGVVPHVFSYGTMVAVADNHDNCTNETRKADAATSETVRESKLIDSGFDGDYSRSGRSVRQMLVR